MSDVSLVEKTLLCDIAKLEADNAALRLKMQGLDRTLADVYAQRDGLQRDLTTLETLVKRLPVVQPHNMTAYMRDFLNFYDREDYDALAALLTHRRSLTQTEPQEGGMGAQTEVTA